MSDSWRFHSDLSDELRKVAVDWVRSNGLDADRVPFNAVFTIDDGQLSTEYIAPGQSFHVGHTTVTVPLVVPLPEPFASAPGAQHAPAPLWRLDVPVVPEHVTAFKDGEGLMWVRRTDDPRLWTRWLDGPNARESRGLTLRIGGVLTLSGLPLIEHPDPRKATT